MRSSAQPKTVVISAKRGWFDLDLRELWAYRELLYFFVWRDVKVRYKQTLIGAGWAILQPFFTMVVFSLFFGKIAKLPSNDTPYPLFYYSGLLPWTYFSTMLPNITNTVVSQQYIITKVYFPRTILPLAGTLPALVDHVLAFSVMGGMMVYYRQGVSMEMLLIPPLLLLAAVAALSVGLWLSALNTLWRDIRYIVPFGVQLWMLASPVIYPLSLVPPKWRTLYSFNPMTTVVEGYRIAITGRGDWPDAFAIASSAAATFVLLLGGLVYFRRIEGTIVDVV